MWGGGYWSIFFSLCIFLHDVMWGGTIGQFFFIMVDKKVIFFKDYLSIFFFFRQTWLRGPHAAPTIEGYWLLKKRIASRTCERQHSRHVFVAHVHEACMCAQGEYRAVSAHTACTLYVACTLHPKRNAHGGSANCRLTTAGQCPLESTECHPIGYAVHIYTQYTGLRVHYRTTCSTL
eukprot:COSAG01_NODE_1248_length_11071_cov_30.622676_11_plen_176_part_01